ncbi:hybrid sensor histidine kinase/response regulator transcription factor [Labilibacter marinus]|uniref:hybrid sensor histidine kinase/response regulator transcription factor n=1 Tax=Labilibacter marinus TaxID=1477105 RepID=UPI00094F49CD|nr:hybrid sensor histidine kinase/response regulator transcription factor [Labilibacter marinus]
MKKITLLIFLFFVLKISFSQEYIFEKITSQQGLSQNDVNCIYQDNNGFLWIGTNDGLNRYDGYVFRTFRIDEANKKGEGLSSNLIYKVSQDTKGRIWVATSNEGVCVFNLETEQFTQIRNTSENPILLADNRVLDLECMSDGSIWVATEKGITIVKEENGAFETTNLISIARTPIVSKGCNFVGEDQQGRKWLGFYSGLVICEYVGNRIKSSMIKGCEKMNVRSVQAVPNGFIIGSGDGLFFLGEKDIYATENKLVELNDYPTTDVCIDSQNNLYTSAKLQLMIYEYNKSTQSFNLKTKVSQGSSKTDLNSNLVMSIYEDSSGIIWIGTNGGGLNKYNPNRKKINHYNKTERSGSIASNKIRAVFEDSNSNIWIGTEGGGVDFLDVSENRNFTSGFKNYASTDPKTENRFYTILETKNSKGESEVWTGAGFPQVLERFTTDGQLASQDLSDSIKSVHASIFSMLKDTKGNIWLGTYGTQGLFKFELNKSEYSIVNHKYKFGKGHLSSNIIRSLLEDSYGNIWIGTDAGLNLLTAEEVQKKHPVFKVFKNVADDKTSLSNDYILPLFESSEGDVWVGTMGGGLNKVNYHSNPDSITFTRYTTQEGFPNNVIKGILEDNNGSLWVSSNMGITQFNPKTHHIMNFDMSDGLQDNEFSELACCKLKDGMMIFGGVNGFNSFYPEQIIIDKTPPQVAFTELQVLNSAIKAGQEVNKRVILDKVINETESIELKYSENSFAIYFSALHFSAPLKNKYKYMLEGFDKSWITKGSNERFAKYTSLKPGKYVFKILASNNDGVWSIQPRKIEIIVVAPWWLSNITLFLYLIVIVALLWFFRRFSFIRSGYKNQLLMEHFEKEKLEELTQMKFRFFTNISHEFRTPLALIIGSVQKLNVSKYNLPEDAKEKCLSIERNSSIMLRLINQLMDFRKMEQDKMELFVSKCNIVPFLQEIFASFKASAINKNITFQLNIPNDSIELWIDEDKIEKIIYNLLSNAIKFTKEKGKVELLVKLNDDDIAIQVKDNGVGIPKAMQANIFERFYQGAKGSQSIYGGTGIGLSYSKGLAELHKGRIQFESIEGVGSCFELILKKGKRHYQSSQLQKNVVSDVNKTMNHNSVEEVPFIKDDDDEVKKDKTSREYSLLVVEDNQELLKFLSDSFIDYYHVYRAENGVEAMTVLMNKDVDLVISDVAMPLKDGFELCADIKSNERISHIPVILLTAKTTLEDSVKGYELGADAYVTKPFDWPILEAQVAAVLKNKVGLKEKASQAIEIIPSEVTTTEADQRFLEKLLQIIEENISNTAFTVEEMAEVYGMPQININKKLKSLTGQTANGFIRSIRLKRASQLLKTGRYTVADVTYEVGFSDLKYFRKCFKNMFHVNPSEYSKSSPVP